MRYVRAGVICLVIVAVTWVAMPAHATYMGKSFWASDTEVLDATNGSPLVSGAWGTTIFEDSPTNFTMWFDSAAGSIHYADSSNGGTSFTDNGAIIISGSLPTGTSTASHAVILKTDADPTRPYEMWYYTGLTQQSEGIAQLAHAYSTDGVTWTDFTTLTQPADATLEILTGHTGSNGWNNGSDGPTCVIYNPAGSATIDTTNAFNNKYVMYYYAYNKLSSVGSTGLAISTDGLTWQLFGGGPTMVGSGTGWDSSESVIWSVFSEGGQYKAFYSGGSGLGAPWDGIGYATSTDGYTWVRDTSSSTTNPIFSTTDGVSYRNNQVWVPRILYVTTATQKYYRMYFSVSDTNGVGGIAYTDGPASNIPEPGTIALMALGLCGLALKRRKKQA